MIFFYLLAYLIGFATLLISKTPLSVGWFIFVVLTWVMSIVSVSLGIVGKIQKKKTGRCTEHTTGEYTYYLKGDREAPGDYFIFRYDTADGEIKGRVAREYTENVDPDSIGTHYDIWYNPAKPKEFTVSKDGKLSTIQKSYEKHFKPGIIIHILCIAVVAVCFLIPIIKR